MKRAATDDGAIRVTVERGRSAPSTSTSSSCTPLNERLGQCEVCAAQPARYACPKCEVKTCCVRCVQIHKKELDCDGIRDRTKFIPLRQMTKMDFMNDYYFLEECTRYVADRKSDVVKRYTHYNKVLPSHLFKLRKAAAQREITLRFLLQHFTRSKQNTTLYNWTEERIYWRIEWCFTNAGQMCHVDERCAEDVPLHKLLEKYVGAQSRCKGLEYYQSVGVFACRVLLKAEGIKRNGRRFFALDVTQTLRENLRGKTLVEHPYIYVSYEQQPAGLEVVDSDEDVSAETKAYVTAIDALHRQQRDRNRSSVDSAEIVEDEATKQSKREKRRIQRDEFEKAPNNFLFSNEQLMDILSSSDEEDKVDADDGNETVEEEENEIEGKK